MKTIRKMTQTERYSMVIDGKNQYCENDYTTRSNLQIQCKLPKAFFTELEQKVLYSLYGNTKDLEYSKQS